MNSTTIVLAVFKPALRKKFELAEIHKCIFKANTITDTLNLEGIGIKKGEVLSSRVELTTLKLSENSEFITMFVNNVKDKINNLKEIKDCNVFIVTVPFAQTGGFAICNHENLFIGGLSTA